MKTINPAKLLMRLGIYCLGLLILAFGIALAVNSNLGVSPISSLPFVLSQIVPISLGTCTTLIYILYILLQMVISRKFRPALLLQLVFSTIFGYFLDGAKFILGDFCLPGYFGQLIMLAVSIVARGLADLSGSMAAASTTPPMASSAMATDAMMAAVMILCFIVFTPYTLCNRAMIAWVDKAHVNFRA